MPIHDIPFPIVDNVDKVASHIASKCLKVKPGELIKVAGGIHQYPLLSKITTEVMCLGAHPILNLTDDHSTVAKINSVPDTHLGTSHASLKTLEAAIDAELIIYSAYDPATEQKKNTEKVKLFNTRNPRKERKARFIGMEWPTLPKAVSYGLDFETFAEIYWKAFWVDLEWLTNKAVKIREKLLKAKEVVITSSDGSVLRLAIDSRPVWIDTGCFTEELIAAGDLTKNLPCGEVYCSPIEDSTNGTVYFEKVFSNGKWIKDLRLTFDKGTIAKIEASTGKEIFTEILNKHTGDKDRIAELGIGINPHVPEIMGNTLLDEKIIGSIHVAIGRNTMYGGINESTLHWDLISMNPTVIADGFSIMEKGKHSSAL